MTLYEWICLFFLLVVFGCYWWEAQGEKLFRQRVLAELAAIPKSRNEDISGQLNSDDYLTADQVAVMLQVSKTTVYSWANAGYIPALRIRGKSHKNVWRFSRRDIETWIAEQKQPVTAKDLFARKESADADKSAGTESGSV